MKAPYFEEIVIEHGTAIFKYIFSLVKQKELAEDLYFGGKRYIPIQSCSNPKTFLRKKSYINILQNKWLKR